MSGAAGAFLDQAGLRGMPKRVLVVRARRHVEIQRRVQGRIRRADRSERPSHGPSKLHSATTSITSNMHVLEIKKIRQALDPLVPVSFTRRRASRSGLSTWWSTRGLTPSRGWESSSRGRLPA